jgi:hypothetical protein
MLPTYKLPLTVFASYVSYWVNGTWYNTLVAGAGLDQHAAASQLTHKTANATFAEWFKPSPQLVSGL